MALISFSLDVSLHPGQRFRKQELLLIHIMKVEVGLILLQAECEVCGRGLDLLEKGSERWFDPVILILRHVEFSGTYHAVYSFGFDRIA
jgi:hypothetical protein